MSGVTGDNPYRASGIIAAAAAGGLSWQDIVTASTLTAAAGNAYWINTTSNACTITLPASAENGDEIIFADYARNWGTNGIVIDSNGLNYQGEDDSFDVEYGTDGQAVDIVYSDATNGWVPVSDDDVEDVPAKGNDNGIFGYGGSPGSVSMSNIVSSAGVVATDVTGVGTARAYVMACEYGGDKGIFGYGYTTSNVSMTNLVTNAGVIGTDVTGVGTARYSGSACEYGGDKGIFGFGNTGSKTAVTNLVTNAGVVGTDVTGVGTARAYLGACEYGGDKGIFGFGDAGPSGSGTVSVTNLVSNTGVVATDTAGVGDARNNLAACSFGGDKGIFIGGASPATTAVSNIVSDAGVVATDVTGVGTARVASAACEYGTDKGIWAYGTDASLQNVSNLVSNVGVVATDTSGVGTARKYLAGCSYN